MPTSILSRPFGVQFSRYFSPLLSLLVLSFAGCGRAEKANLVIVEKVLHKQAATNVAVPLEFADMAPAAGSTFWIEGRVKNAGAVEAKNVRIIFRCVHGKSTQDLMAEVDILGPGETSDFRTNAFQSTTELQLPEEEQPYITFE